MWKVEIKTRLALRSMNTAELKIMSTAERLQTMEAIWESLISDENEISPPDWRNDVLTDRKAKIESGKAEFQSISDLKSSSYYGSDPKNTALLHIELSIKHFIFLS
jgi:hypothetical protein